MPNTKSAERRVRSSERLRVKNRKVKTNLKALQKKLDAAITENKKDDAAATYRKLSSALDKAAKVGVIPKTTAARKRSRLALAVNKVK
jgi:small subunit ribosomal protein S20